MNANIEKAARVTASILKKNPGMDRDFAESIGLHMVLTGNYKLKDNRAPVFLAGEGAAQKFRKQLEAAA